MSKVEVCLRDTRPRAGDRVFRGRRLQTTRDNVENYNDRRSGRGLNEPAVPAAEAPRRAKFAKELARSEFGRFYFDERLESLMRQAMRQRRRPSGKDRG